MYIIKSKLSVIMNILSNMEQIAELIIRPSRYLYKPIDLGPKQITVDDKQIYHHNFELKNPRNLTLKASLYTPMTNLEEIDKIIVYLHCNSGCRIQGLAYLKMAISSGFSYFVFDFAGSGLSDGRYISLGWFEVSDVESVLNFIDKNINSKAKIILWGRSMGAVTALRYLAKSKYKNKKIVASIYDSPFYSLKDIFIEIGKQKTGLPKLVLEMALKYIKPIVKKKAKFNLDDVYLQNLKEVNYPGIFIASKNDSLIPFTQMDTIFREYKGEKQMFFVEESHNQPRNPDVISEVFKALQKYIHTPIQDHFYQDADKFISQIPPKETSRKKLQLTIKSYSQRSLLLSKDRSQPKKSLDQISFPNLQKRQISCLLERTKQPLKQNSQTNNHTQIKSPTQPVDSSLTKLKKPVTIAKFFKDQNMYPLKQPPSEVVIKYKNKSNIFAVSNQNVPRVRDQERKTMQHMAHKKPPYIEKQRLSELRNSLESKYKSEFKK